MGIKLDPKTKKFIVSYSKRHPKTNQPVSLRRVGIDSEARARKVLEEIRLTVHLKLKEVLCPRWPKLIDEYFEDIKQTDLRNQTLYSREKMLRAYTLPKWEKKFTSEITGNDIHHIILHDMAGKAESHKKFLVKCVRAVMQFALDKNYIQRNPTPLLKFKANEKIKAVLTEEQIKKLLHRAQEVNWEWYPHYAVALYTGMRNGELYALTWDKVNLEQRTILVNCSWSDKDGYKSTKSGDDRIVEIPKPLMPLLKELKLNSASSHFVLPRLIKWDKGEQARILRMFLQLCDLPEVRFHDLRASWATLLLGKGVVPSKVMSMGGWKDMDTMMIYMRKAGINIKGATSVLDDLETHGVDSAEIVELKKKL